MGFPAGRGRGRGGSHWTHSLARSSISARGRGGKGKGGGRSGHYGHDDRVYVRANDTFLKKKHSDDRGAGRGRGKGKSKGKGKGRDREEVAPPVQEVPEEQLRRHCEVKKAHGAPVTCIVMNKTDGTIYTGSIDKSLKRWKTTVEGDGRFVLNCDINVPLGDSCNSCLFHEGWLFCGLFNGDIQAFSQEGVEQKLSGHRRAVTTILIHQSIVISGSRDHTIRLWQFDAGTKKFICIKTLEELEVDQITKLHVLGNTLVVGGREGIAVVNLETLIVSKMLPPRKHVADLLEFQEHIIAAYADGSLRIFDASGTPKSETKPMPAGTLLKMAGLESGPRVLCGHARGQVSTIALPNFDYRLHFQAFDDCKVESILCTNTDGFFVLGSQDGSIQLWQRVGA